MIANAVRVAELARERLHAVADYPEALAFLQLAERQLDGAAPRRADPDDVVAARYTVGRLLGEGRRKQVHLAHDTVLDRDVALAWIELGDLDEAARTRVVREAQVMARLGAHPRIVPIYDMGFHNAQMYVVAEYLDGGDLDALIRTAPDGHLPGEQVISLGRAICEGLAFAHQSGVIHRDVKPSNVWLSKAGAVKLGDFGLAHAQARIRLTEERVVLGTAAYMAPEQAIGGAVAAHSDLYALGALLYESVTGRPPFLGDDEITIISQHINTAPVRPAWHNPKCPAALDALIMRLLANDPNARPESAEEVAAALADIHLGAKPTTHNEPRGLESLAGGVFVGRQREMTQLKSALDSTVGGSGKLVMLTGEPGIGKTRISDELGIYAVLRHAVVLVGRCYEGEGVPPYWPWVQALRE